MIKHTLDYFKNRRAGLLRRRPSYLLASLVTLLYCGACSTSKQNTVPDSVDPSPPPASVIIDPAPDGQVDNNAVMPDNIVFVDKADKAGNGAQSFIQDGTGQFIAAPPAAEDKTRLLESPEDPEESHVLNVQGVDIHDFLKLVLRDILGKNFIVDPEVRGSITIDTSTPFQKNELFPLLESVLAMNDIAITYTNGIYYILPKAKASRGVFPTSSEQVDADGYRIRIISLSYISAQEMEKILQPFMPKGSSIRVDGQRNMLVLGGTARELDTLQETIDIFDVDWLKGMSMGLFPLEHVDSKTLKQELDTILSSIEGNKTNELVRTVAIERLNSILLISPVSSALAKAEAWLHRLDTRDEQIGRRLYVYNVQNSKAEELAGTLEKIFADSPSSRSADSGSLPRLAPGTTAVEINGTPEGTSEAAGDGSINLTLSSSDPVKIIADDTHNALLIMASPVDYKLVIAAIKALDVIPLQVLIEASIIEVTLTDDLNYGVEWFFNNSIGSDREGRGILDLGSTGISAIAPGFSYTVINSAENVRLAINTLAQASNVNVLSAPSLMVLDNQSAYINVGDEIPIPTQQAISTIDPDAPTVNEISYRNTGISLNVTPRVNDSGLVTMEIKQEVSLPVTTTSSNIDAPTIQQRTIETTVAISSGESIVLGGLILDTDSSAESGLFGLYKIPLIGKLFGQKTFDNRHSELIVLLTPRVVKNLQDARDITDEFRRKLKQLYPIAQPDSP